MRTGKAQWNQTVTGPRRDPPHSSAGVGRADAISPSLQDPCSITPPGVRGSKWMAADFSFFSLNFTWLYQRQKNCRPGQKIAGPGHTPHIGRNGTSPNAKGRFWRLSDFRLSRIALSVLENQTERRAWKRRFAAKFTADPARDLASRADRGGHRFKSAPDAPQRACQGAADAGGG